MAGVSLRKIAEKVGCSRSTVSYALKNHPSISVGMRNKIKKVADELGWHPDAELARHMSLVRKTLAAGNLPNLAIVVNKSEADLKHEFAPRAQVEGAHDYAVKRGYSVDIFNLVERPVSAKRLKEILQARGIQGIVFVATVAPEIPLDYLKVGRDFATAVVGVRYLEEPYHVAIPDWKSASRVAILKILEMHFKRPGIILPRGLDRTLDWGFGSGAFAGQQELREEDRLPVCYFGKDESGIPDYARDDLLAWIERHRPDCLLTTDGRNLPALLAQSSRAKTRNLPVFVLDLGDQEGVKGGIDERHLEVGKAGVELVVAQMHRQEAGVPEVQRAVLIEGRWRMRK